MAVKRACLGAGDAGLGPSWRQKLRKKYADVSVAASGMGQYLLLLARVGPAPTGCVQHTQQLLLSLWQQQSLQSLKSRICNRFGQ